MIMNYIVVLYLVQQDKIFKMIILTESALNEVKRAKASLVSQSADEATQDLCLRLSVKSAEGSGLIYSMDFDKKAESDEVTERGGLTIVIDPTSYSFLKNVTLDFDNLQKGFKFINPDVKSDCND